MKYYIQISQPTEVKLEDYKSALAHISRSAVVPLSSRGLVAAHQQLEGRGSEISFPKSRTVMQSRTDYQYSSRLRTEKSQKSQKKMRRDNATRSR